MAWTAPMTFLPNTVLTAAQLNTHLRDNLLELAPAKATTAGGLFNSAGPNRIEQRVPKSARVSTYQDTKRTDYGNLSTAGPTVTVMTGTSALVFIGAAAKNTELDQASYMSYQITGATAKDPGDTNALLMEGMNANLHAKWSQVVAETELKPGLNTFTCKYKSGSDEQASQFGDRFICVWPF